MKAEKLNTACEELSKFEFNDNLRREARRDWWEEIIWTSCMVRAKHSVGDLGI